MHTCRNFFSALTFRRDFFSSARTAPIGTRSRPTGPALPNPLRWQDLRAFGIPWPIWRSGCIPMGENWGHSQSGRQMRLRDLIQSIEASIATSCPSQDIEIEGIYAGDRISDLLSKGTARTLLVTNLTGLQIVRVAELMDVPAFCLLNDVTPNPELIEAAETHGKVLLVSPLSMFETCGRFYRRLEAAGEVCP